MRNLRNALDAHTIAEEESDSQQEINPKMLSIQLDELARSLDRLKQKNKSVINDGDQKTKRAQELVRKFRLLQEKLRDGISESDSNFNQRILGKVGEYLIENRVDIQGCVEKECNNLKTAISSVNATIDKPKTRKETIEASINELTKEIGGLEGKRKAGPSDFALISVQQTIEDLYQQCDNLGIFNDEELTLGNIFELQKEYDGITDSYPCGSDDNSSYKDRTIENLSDEEIEDLAEEMILSMVNEHKKSTGADKKHIEEMKKNLARLQELLEDVSLKTLNDNRGVIMSTSEHGILQSIDDVGDLYFAFHETYLKELQKKLVEKYRDTEGTLSGDEKERLEKRIFRLGRIYKSRKELQKVLKTTAFENENSDFVKNVAIELGVMDEDNEFNNGFEVEDYQHLKDFIENGNVFALQRSPALLEVIFDSLCYDAYSIRKEMNEKLDQIYNEAEITALVDGIQGLHGELDNEESKKIIDRLREYGIENGGDFIRHHLGEPDEMKSFLRGIGVPGKKRDMWFGRLVTNHSTIDDLLKQYPDTNISDIRSEILGIVERYKKAITNQEGSLARFQYALRFHKRIYSFMELELFRYNYDFSKEAHSILHEKLESEELTDDDISGFIKDNNNLQRVFIDHNQWLLNFLNADLNGNKLVAKDDIQKANQEIERKIKLLEDYKRLLYHEKDNIKYHDNILKAVRIPIVAQQKLRHKIEERNKKFIATIKKEYLTEELKLSHELLAKYQADLETNYGLVSKYNEEGNEEKRHSYTFKKAINDLEQAHNQGKFTFTDNGDGPAITISLGERREDNLIQNNIDRKIEVAEKIIEQIEFAITLGIKDKEGGGGRKTEDDRKKIEEKLKSKKDYLLDVKEDDKVLVKKKQLLLMDYYDIPDIEGRDELSKENLKALQTRNEILRQNLEELKEIGFPYQESENLSVIAKRAADFKAAAEEYNRNLKQAEKECQEAREAFKWSKDLGPETDPIKEQFRKKFEQSKNALYSNKTPSIDQKLLIEFLIQIAREQKNPGSSVLELIKEIPKELTDAITKERLTEDADLASEDRFAEFTLFLKKVTSLPKEDRLAVAVNQRQKEIIGLLNELEITEIESVQDMAQLLDGFHTTGGFLLSGSNLSHQYSKEKDFRYKVDENITKDKGFQLHKQVRPDNKFYNDVRGKLTSNKRGDPVTKKEVFGIDDRYYSIEIIKFKFSNDVLANWIPHCASLRHCDFDNVDFSQTNPATFKSINFNNCRFENCKFSAGMKNYLNSIYNSASNLNFQGCKVGDKEFEPEKTSPLISEPILAGGLSFSGRGGK